MKSFLLDGLSKQITQIDVTDRAGTAALIGFSLVGDGIISEAEIAVFMKTVLFVAVKGDFKSILLDPSLASL
jgi:hypothetical protein|tara:strand:- start:118 stop:333 length:216 start_codon:yes stop_codon:yes gene_type:complete